MSSNEDRKSESSSSLIKDITNQLISNSIRKGSTDNISWILIAFKKFTPSPHLRLNLGTIFSGG